MSSQAKIRVLIVDDSALVRKVLSEAFARDPELEVVGTASDPYAARDKINELAPHVLTLDIEMPRMDGLSFLRILMEQRPMPVVMVSTLTAAGADVTLEALAIGAVDVVEKPTVDVLRGLDERLPELLAKIKAAARSRPRGAAVRAKRPPHAASVPQSVPQKMSVPQSVPQKMSVPQSVPQKTSVPHPSARQRSPLPLHTAPDDAAPSAAAPRSAFASRVARSLPGSLPDALPEVVGSVPSVTGSAPDTRGSLPARSGSAPATRTTLTRSAPTRAASLPHKSSPDTARAEVALFAVGASTGGTEALRELLASLPPDSPAVVIVQHMPAEFTRAFARRCDAHSPLRVVEAEHGSAILPGHAYIAPGGRHMRVVRHAGGLRIALDDGERVNLHRPSVDALFDSVASIVGPRALGAILTGMGDDGARGLLKMREAGAHTIAQDRETCVVFGMPREAIALGAAVQVLPLQDIAAAAAARFART